MTGLDVVCPGCRKSFHETTDAFTPHRSPNGSMVRLKDPWRKWGWCTFGDAQNGLPPNIAERSNTYWSAMDCPGCCAPLAPSGKILVRHKDGREFVPSPEPVPVDNTVDGRLVFDVDYSELELEWSVQKVNTEPETRDEKILRLRSEGMTFAQIGEAVGLSAEMARRIVKKAET